MPVVAIIGLDGSGKTTQARLLTQRLKEAGVACRCLRADYALIGLLSTCLKLPADRLLPSPRKERAGPPRKRSLASGLFLRTFGLPYAWACYAIVAFYGRGWRVAVCDRYFYQFLYDIYGTGARSVIRLLPKPDMAYLLDGSLELFRSRMTNPFDRDVSSQYYAAVHSLLREMTSSTGFVAVDASQDARKISDFIFDDLREKLGVCRQVSP